MQVDHYQYFAPLKRDVFTGEKDVFGDGSVIVFETPGHTPGHTSLQLNMPETGYVLLTGDLYHRATSRDLKRVPRFNFSEPQTIETFRVFEERVAALNAKVIIQHERADIEPLGGVIR
jgi:glyoxylase-like metal-dependent hydrolase (beta-lactamase superfamily II)